MSDLAQLLVDAAALGGLYALYALGIALIFGIMRLINFAHASLMLVAGYAVVLTSDFPLVARLTITLVVTIMAALIIDRVAFRPVRGQPPTTLLVTSFAVFIVVTSLAESVFGALPLATTVSEELLGRVDLGPIDLQRLTIVVLVVAILLLALVTLLLNRTRIGIQMRAVAEDITAAQLMGINVEAVIRVAFTVSAVLAAAAAVLLISQTGTVTPTFGLQPVLIGLVATVLGGMTDLKSAVLGGFALGVFSQIVQAVLPPEVRVYRDALVFGVAFIMLVLRPGGLFARQEARV